MILNLRLHKRGEWHGKEATACISIKSHKWKNMFFFTANWMYPLTDTTVNSVNPTAEILMIHTQELSELPVNLSKGSIASFHPHSQYSKCLCTLPAMQSQTSIKHIDSSPLPEKAKPTTSAALRLTQRADSSEHYWYQKDGRIQIIFYLFLFFFISSKVGQRNRFPHG